MGGRLAWIVQWPWGPRRVDGGSRSGVYGVSLEPDCLSSPTSLRLLSHLGDADANQTCLTGRGKVRENVELGLPCSPVVNQTCLTGRGKVRENVELGLPCSPVVQTPYFHCRDHGFNP